MRQTQSLEFGLLENLFPIFVFSKIEKLSSQAASGVGLLTTKRTNLYQDKTISNKNLWSFFSSINSFLMKVMTVYL